jgi:hypothetical protein
MGIALHEPKNYRAIMVSSTFTDLKEHRQKLIDAIHPSHKSNVMEHDGARPKVNVIESSLQMVRDSAAYIGVISRKYGQALLHPRLNPHRLSLTELEFNEAVRLDRPILLFIMDEKHSVTEADIELDPDKRKKLEEFRESAKKMGDGSEVERIYEVFESLEQFSTAAIKAVGRLAQYLAANDRSPVEVPPDPPKPDTTLPHPPALAALPRYLGSHPFVGRTSELQTLSDWCGAADPNPMLLFEAMGGLGKSMLTWEWLTRHSTSARGNWVGRFWYSFYEKGAVMADFCRQALAYMTMKPAGDFAKLQMPELTDLLIAKLEKRPWLIALDGLERILVAYHRYDAAQLRDEEIDTASDQIGKRDPCATIRPEDDDLLRRLARVAPSKILVSSRLTPLTLVNRSGMPVPGVRREILAGLRPIDAEAMIRTTGVTGRSQNIQAYLQTNCDCHPLAIGVLGGLINGYPPARGNFDRWADDPRYGAALDLAKLDLVQRRNHILLAAIDALPLESRQLLQTLALLQGGSDFDTLDALNPLPLGEPDKLRDAIRDLEKRGLLQYDSNGKKYDLHPVVRGVAAGRMGGDETEKVGQKVVDYFTSKPHDPWENAETLEDVAPGLQIVRVLLRMQRYEEALWNYRGDLSNALSFNLDADAEILALLKPFFPDGWDGEIVPLNVRDLSYLLNETAIALSNIYPDSPRKMYERLIALGIENLDTDMVVAGVYNFSLDPWKANRLADASRLWSLILEIPRMSGITDSKIFVSKMRIFEFSVECGDKKESNRLRRQIEDTGRNLSRSVYRSGDAELRRARELFYRGELVQNFLTQAEDLAKRGRNRRAMHGLTLLRGERHLARGEPKLAVNSLGESVRMAREVGHEDPVSEALFALARLRAGDRFDARGEAARLNNTNGQAALAIAELWHELGERDLAVEHALRAHRWAVADGEPCVHRYYLDRTRALLIEFGATLPKVPRYDLSKATTYPWEKDVQAFIEKLKIEGTAAAKMSNGRKRTGRRAKSDVRVRR